MRTLASTVVLPVRRLPVVPNAGAAVEQPAVSESSPGPSPDQIKSDLAAAFSAELAELHESARLRGYQEGKANASQEIAACVRSYEDDIRAEYLGRLASLEEAATSVRLLMERLDGEYRAALADLEPIAVEIAFTALTQMIGRAERYKELLSDLVNHAFGMVGRKRDALQVVMASSDLAILSETEGASWVGRVVPDEALPPGSCVIEVGSRSLDVGLMQQVEALRLCLLKACSERGHE